MNETCLPPTVLIRVIRGCLCGLAVDGTEEHGSDLEIQIRIQVSAMTPARLTPLLPLVLFALSGFVRAEETIPFARVAPIFRERCHGCHGPAKSKGDLRLDKLNPDLVQGSDGDRWREVLDRLSFGDMPPETEPPLAVEQRELLIQWLQQERKRASLAKNPATHFRRLTRREYERTMQDLLGLPIDFGNRLPEDGRSKDGFRNNGEMLRMSPLQYETYLQIAQEALAEAIVSGPAPEVHRYRLAPGEKANSIKVTSLPKPETRPGESFVYDAQAGKPFRIWNMSTANKDYDGLLPPSAIRRYSEAAIQLPQHCFAIGFHRAFRKGEMLIRVRAARFVPPPSPIPRRDPPSPEAQETPAKPASNRPPALTVALGCTNFHGVELKSVAEPRVVDHADFRTYEFRVRMESMPVPNTGAPADKNAAVLAVWNSVRAIKDEQPPPRLKIEWVELESPYLETWPPATHANILFPPDGTPDEPTYARAVVQRFAARAFRRPLEKHELDRLMTFWSAARRDAESLEASLRDTLCLVLTSPQFLGLPATRSSTGSTAPADRQRLDDHELAARLSYFLWSSLPDEPLQSLAAGRQLRDPAVLAGQTRRMIQDPRAWQFIEQFTEQWLELDRLQRVTVNRERYPGFDEQLAESMRLETVHFFGEVLRSDVSAFRLLDADFTCVNETLAAHYGIVGVVGPQFRRVPLDPALHRGGVLTHASVLTGNSDGVDGHPIKRGIWLLKNLLDETPPPPPPNVPELNRNDPKVRGLTIPQTLAQHRDSAACSGCHRKIDPWGLAFEEYDAVGHWQRDGLGAELRKRRTRHPIEAATELPNGTKVDGLQELRAELLRSKSDEFRRAVLRKVLAYALGRSLTLADQEAADTLVPALKARQDRLAAVIELVVASEPFQSK